MSTDATSAVELLLAPLPDACKDLRLNMSTILRGSERRSAHDPYCAAIAARISSAIRPWPRRCDRIPSSLLNDEEAADAQPPRR